jgi:hypothetical protein
MNARDSETAPVSTLQVTVESSAVPFAFKVRRAALASVL